VDIWSKKKRSEVMSRIRGKNTKPEKILRGHLFKQGFRFRLHQNNLPGKPDIVLTKYRTVIFVHGCFWHYHRQCREGRIPSTNSNFWREKLFKNIKKDKANSSALKKQNWKVITVWECEIEGQLSLVLNMIKEVLAHEQ